MKTRAAAKLDKYRIAHEAMMAADDHGDPNTRYMNRIFEAQFYRKIHGLAAAVDKFPDIRWKARDTKEEREQKMQESSKNRFRRCKFPAHVDWKENEERSQRMVDADRKKRAWGKKRDLKMAAKKEKKREEENKNKG